MGRVRSRVGGGRLFSRECRATHPNEEDFSIVGWGRLPRWSVCTTHPNEGRRYTVTQLQSYKGCNGCNACNL